MNPIAPQLVKKMYPSLSHDVTAAIFLDTEGTASEGQTKLGLALFENWNQMR